MGRLTPCAWCKTIAVVTSKAGYWIGGGLMVVAVLGAILWAYGAARNVIGVVDDFQHVPVPGRSAVDLEARKYVIYVEGPNADGVVPPVAISVTDARTERRVALRDYGGELTYSFDTSGSAYATITPPRAGRYDVRVRAGTVGEGSGFQLAIGESIGGKIVGGLVGTFAIGGVFGIAGLVLLIVTGVRRSNRRARAA